jgi:predicted RNA-binding protein with PIN domain
MAYLIDGYNLLHAMGALTARAGPHGLEKARRRLLGMLQSAFGGATAEDVTVVLDAAHALPGVPAEQDEHGIHVYFAVHQQQADDLIADLIRHHSAPQQLAVVSDDHEVQQAARHRHCRVLKCLDFLDEAWRQRRRSQAHSEPDPKPDRALSESETQDWLQAFADLADDAELGRPFFPYDMGDEDNFNP